LKENTFLDSIVDKLRRQTAKSLSVSVKYSVFLYVEIAEVFQ
jgi:hypothetical protein